MFIFQRVTSTSINQATLNASNTPAHVQIITEVPNATLAMNHGQTILHSASGRPGSGYKSEVADTLGENVGKPWEKS